MSYNRAAMGLQGLTVERYEGVADDQRMLLLRGPITIETAPQFEQAVHHERAETKRLSTRKARPSGPKARIPPGPERHG